MAQETKVEETHCSLQTFERNRYFYGKPMTVSDFEAEQRYLMGKHRYINRLVNGAGVLCGLQVTLPDNFSAEHPTVELTEGAALDCCGNLIVVSRSATPEVKGQLDPAGLNYIYIKYAECAKQPVVSASNGASCEEVCCYNRIQETYEIISSATPPAGASSGSGDVGGAPPTRGGPAPSPATPASATAPSAGPSASVPSATDAASACHALAEKYYQEHLRTSPECEDPQVLLAVIDMEKGVIDEAKTARYRSVVYSNPMLEALMCGHVADFENPHRTTAAQLGALQSVNRVGNAGSRDFVSNIDLTSQDKTIGVVPDVNNSTIDLLLSPDAVRVTHLHEEVIKNLLQSSKTVLVEPDGTGKKISLRTNPAKKVTSVGGAKVVGASSSYAPEDHAHDLSEGVVLRKHLSEEVYGNLIQGAGIIKVKPDAAGRTIHVTADTAPADDVKVVSSVGGTKRVGGSGRFAREDHAHDLRINGRSPDELGEFILSPGANVNIERGAGENELVISSSAQGGAANTTGLYVFGGVLPQEVHTSSLIPHGLEAETVAVVVAEEDVRSIRRIEVPLTLVPLSFIAHFGDVTAFAPENPNLMATLNYTERTIQIRLKDNRPRSETALERTYRVRWWAIPAVKAFKPPVQ